MSPPIKPWRQHHDHLCSPRRTAGRYATLAALYLFLHTSIRARGGVFKLIASTRALDIAEHRHLKPELLVHSGLQQRIRGSLPAAA